MVIFELFLAGRRNHLKSTYTHLLTSCKKNIAVKDSRIANEIDHLIKIIISQQFPRAIQPAISFQAEQVSYALVLH